ncbi:hypothetical protein LZ30DRAFT_812172 [Colletotrichum cereale]|nr:hypothetical protein LZ30DRAFT_812172 [Colletotrichum cereale]
MITILNVTEAFDRAAEDVNDTDSDESSEQTNHSLVNLFSRASGLTIGQDKALSPVEDGLVKLAADDRCMLLAGNHQHMPIGLSVTEPMSPQGSNRVLLTKTQHVRLIVGCLAQVDLGVEKRLAILESTSNELPLAAHDNARQELYGQRFALVSYETSLLRRMSGPHLNYRLVAVGPGPLGLNGNGNRAVAEGAMVCMVDGRTARRWRTVLIRSASTLPSGG